MIVASRATVPDSVCDVRIMIANHDLPGRILYLGTVSILTVDAALLPRSLYAPGISAKSWKVGDEVELFALDDAQQLIQKRCQISGIRRIATSRSKHPRWRIINTEGISLLEWPYSSGGILIDPEDKSIVALWIKFETPYNNGTIKSCMTGLSYDFYISPVIESLRSDRELQPRYCNWEFRQMLLSAALDLGLPERRADQIAAIAKPLGSGPLAIFVSGKLRPLSKAESNLEIGDIILEINQKPVGRMADVRSLSHLETVNMVILRNGKESEITLYQAPLPPESNPRVISWAGAIVHETHSAVLEQVTPEFVRVCEREELSDIEHAVYISSVMSGCPSYKDLGTIQWILEIDGCRIRSLDDLLEIISSLRRRSEEEEYIQVKVLRRNGRTEVVSVRLDSKFWPAWILERKENAWVRTELG
jgi:pro-apoptotic serine protease NMA111